MFMSLATFRASDSAIDYFVIPNKIDVAKIFLECYTEYHLLREHSYQKCYTANHEQVIKHTFPRIKTMSPAASALPDIFAVENLFQIIYE